MPPIAPVFVADVPTLKSSLRLSGLPAGADSEAILNDAMLKVRSDFYRRLGHDRMQVIMAPVYTEEPTTADEYMRLLANVTEIKMVRLEVMRVLPVAFFDSSASANQNWDDEAPLRDGRPSDFELERRRLESEIENNMEILAFDEAVGSETSIRASSIGPSTTPPRPGDSVWGSRSSSGSGDV